MTEQSRPSAATGTGIPTGVKAGVQAGPSATGASGQGAVPAPAARATPGAAAAKAVVGPLTVRDLAVLGAVAIIFVASVIPLVIALGTSLNLWNTSGLFYIGVGVVLPLIVGGLFLVRRMNPASKIRIGSLSTDQFASVVAAFATYFFFAGTVSNFSIAFLVGLIGSLLLLVSTVCAQWIPVLAADFTGRDEAPAHVAALDAVPAVKRPAAPRPVAAQAGAPGAGQQQFGQAPFGQAGPAQGAGVQGAGQYVPAQQGGAQQGGWNAPVASTHTKAGQIFTPAKETPAGAGAIAAGAASAAAGTAATNSAHGAAATGAGAAGATGSTTAATSATAAGAGAAQAASAVAPSAVNQAAANAGAADHTSAASAAQPKDEMATSLNPQVAGAAKPEAVAESPAPAKESITATVNPSPVPVVAEPFWFAVDRPQNVIDEKTRQFAFKLAPGAWILALEDRGTSFLVQDSHGKTGVLLDLVGIERASDSQ